MAHFAELDKDNFVARVIVISNDDILDENGNESENMGIEICKTCCGADSGPWLQTSVNNSFRKNFAVVGWKYSSEKDVFYNPVQPFPSWSLNDNYDWEAPIPRPSTGYWDWDEESLSWKEALIDIEESSE